MEEGSLDLYFNPDNLPFNVFGKYTASISKEERSPQIKIYPATNRMALRIDEFEKIVYSMTLYCELVDLGYPNASSCGVLISGTNPEPTVYSCDSKLIVNESLGYGLKEHIKYSFEEVEVTPDGSAYIRAFAENNKCITYSDVMSISFAEPKLSSTSVLDVAISSAMLSSTIIEAGNPQYTERGFIVLRKKDYDENPSSAISDLSYRHKAAIPDNNVIGEWSMLISDLLPGTDYVASSYLTEGNVIWYEDVVGFSTYQSPDVVTLQAVVQTKASYSKGPRLSLMGSKVTFYGSIENQDKTQYVERGFIVGSSYASSPDNPSNTVYSLPNTGESGFSFQTYTGYGHTSQSESVWAYAKTSNGELYIGNKVLF
jgi:hypothetical protein